MGIATFLFVNAREVIALLASREYIEHTKYVYTSLDAMQIVVFIFLFFFLSSLFTYLLIANSEQKKLLRINAIITVANLVGNLIFIPLYSFVGSAWVTLICQIILLVQTYWATRHIARFDFLPSFTATTVAFAVTAGAANYLLLGYLHMSTIVVLIASTTAFSTIYLGGIGLVFGKKYLRMEKKMVM